MRRSYDDDILHKIGISLTVHMYYIIIYLMYRYTNLSTSFIRHSLLAL